MGLQNDYKAHSQEHETGRGFRASSLVLGAGNQLLGRRISRLVCSDPPSHPTTTETPGCATGKKQWRKGWQPCVMGECQRAPSGPRARLHQLVSCRHHSEKGLEAEGCGFTGPCREPFPHRVQIRGDIALATSTWDSAGTMEAGGRGIQLLLPHRRVQARSFALLQPQA